MVKAAILGYGTVGSGVFEILNTTVAIAIVIPNFAAINGIIGLIKPVYESFIKCPNDNQVIAFFF